jgi:hypothetical protein
VDQDQLEQEPRPNPAASSSSESVELPFEPLEGAEQGGKGQSDGSPPEWENLGPAKPAVEPFTDEEIVNGTMFVTLFAGAKLTKTEMTSPADVALYQQAYCNVFGSIVPTQAMIAPLKLGEALARYGVGKGMMPGSLDVLPPYLRLTLGAAVLGMSSYLAFGAVKREQASHSEPPRPETKEKDEAPPQNPHGDDSGGWQQPAGVAAS